ncbi:MAG: ABC transporter substrate-binding protein [Burkholderiaceae bacterium]
MTLSTLCKIAFTVAAGLAASVASVAHAEDKVRVGVFASSSALPYFVGLERGYFKEAGIAVETVTLASAPLIVQSLVSGDIDAASNLVTLEGANISQRRPNTLTYISLNGQNAQYITEQFVVKAGSHARTLKDLKGARLFSAPGPANVGTAKAVLKAIGLEENKDYTMQEQQLSVHLGALQAGTFDAGYTLEPVASTMIKQGVARRLEAGVISTHLLGNPSSQAFAAGGALSNKLIAERPDVAARFARAWAKAVAAANSDASARDLLAKDMNVPAALAATVPLANFVMVRDMTPAQKTDFQKFVDIGVGLGVVKGAVDAGAMIRGM